MYLVTAWLGLLLIYSSWFHHEDQLRVALDLGHTAVVHFTRSQWCAGKYSSINSAYVECANFCGANILLHDRFQASSMSSLNMEHGAWKECAQADLARWDQPAAVQGWLIPHILQNLARWKECNCQLVNHSKLRFNLHHLMSWMTFSKSLRVCFLPCRSEIISLSLRKKSLGAQFLVYAVPLPLHCTHQGWGGFSFFPRGLSVFARAG